MTYLLKQIIVVILGLCIAGIGVGIFLFSGLGVDPASVFQTGLSNILNISYGTASALSNIIIISVVLIIDKKYINIATIIAIVAIGYTADFANFILNTIIVNEIGLLFRMFFILFGCFIMSLGIAIYIRAKLGVGAIDSVSEVISDKLHLDYKKVRVTSDLLFVVVGTLLGGALGFGTIVAAFLTGPFVQWIRPKSDKIIGSFLKKC